MTNTLQVKIEASADKVWEILAHRYCEVADWTTNVQRSWPMESADVPQGLSVAPQAPFPGRSVVTPWEN